MEFFMSFQKIINWASITLQLCILSLQHCPHWLVKSGEDLNTNNWKHLERRQVIYSDLNTFCKMQSLNRIPYTVNFYGLRSTISQVLQALNVLSFSIQPPKSEFVPYPHYQRVVNARRDKEKRMNEEVRSVCVWSIQCTSCSWPADLIATPHSNEYREKEKWTKA